MPEALQISIPVVLDTEKITEDVKKIQKQLSDNNTLFLNLKFADDSITNIKKQLDNITKQQYNINVGISNGNVKSQLGSIRKQVEQINDYSEKMNNFGNTSENSMTKVVTSGKKAESAIKNVNSSINQTSQSLLVINTEYTTTFANATDVINRAVKEFERFGEVTAVSNKPVFTENGEEYYKNFTIQVKSATGEIQKFRYVMQQSDDDSIYYQLQNINEAVIGLKKLQSDIDKFKVTYTSKIEAFKKNNISLGLSKEISDFETTLANVSSYQDFDNIKISFDKLNAASSEIRKNLQSVGKSLDPVENAIKTIDTTPIKIQELANGFYQLKEQPKDVVRTIEQLKSDLQRVLELEKQGGKNTAWSEAYKTLITDIQKAENQLKLAQMVEKGSTSNSFLNDVDNYKVNLKALSTEWKQQGLLIGNIKAEVVSLQRGISAVRKPETLQEYVVRLQEIATNVQRVKSNLDGQIDSQNKIYQIQTQIANLDSGDISNKTLLEHLLQEEQQHLQNLQTQGVTLKNIISLEEQERFVTEQTADARQKLNLAENHQQDKQYTKSISDMERYTKSITKAVSSLENLKNANVFSKYKNNFNVQTNISEINDLIVKLKNAQTRVNTLLSDSKNSGSIDIEKFKALSVDMEQLNQSVVNVTDSTRNFQTILKQNNSIKAQSDKITVLIHRLEAFAVANSKAMKSSTKLDSGKTVSQEWNEMMFALKNAPDNETFKNITSQFQSMRFEVKKLGLEGNTVFQSLLRNIKKFASWMGMTTLTMQIVHEIRGLFTTVQELDTALIDLRKTFKGTVSDLEDFYYSANETAKKMGVTTQEIINQASAWSRLGYSTKEAATEMATLSSMFASISPGVDVDTATTGLVSIMKAFDIEVDDVKESIISKINEIGNTRATDNGDILEGLSKSSSAMAAMNATLDETIALFTAGQEILQDSDRMGNALKSVAMRIRGYDEETNELSDDLTEIKGKVIDLTKIESNDYKGISLFTDETQTHYKSIYNYLVEIADIYDELSEKNQQEILENLFGKYQVQAGAAIIKNIDAAKISMQTMAENSLGSADREMEVIKDSIEFVKNEFDETITGIAQSTISRDFEKSILTSSIKLLDTLSDTASPLNGILTTISDIFSVIANMVEQLGLLPSVIGAISLSKGLKNIGLFRTINADTEKLSGRIGILHRSFADIKTDFSTLSKSNGGIKNNWTNIFNIATKKDVQNFNDYCKAVEQGTNSAQAFTQYIQGSPTVIRQQALEFAKTNNELVLLNQNYKAGKINTVDYTTSSEALKLKLASLKTEIQSITVAEKAMAVASNLLKTAMMAALNIGVSIAISAVLSYITKLIHKEEELIEKNKELASTYEDNIKLLDDLRESYLDILNSTDSESEKTERLIDWKKQLIEQYGFEEEALKNVNLERQTGLELIELEKYKEAEKTIANLKDYDEAFEKIYNGVPAGHFVFWYGKKKIDLSDVAQFGLSGLYDEFDSVTNSERNFGEPNFFALEYDTQNVYEQAEALINALSYYKTLRDRGLDPDNNNSKTIQYLEDEYDRVKEIIDNYGTTVSTGVAAYAQKFLYEFTQQTDGQLGNVVDQTTYEAWSDKLLSFAGDSEPLKNALKELAQQMFPSYSESVIKADNDTNRVVSSLSSLADIYSEINSQLEDILDKADKFKPAMQKIAAGYGLTADEVQEILDIDSTLVDKFVKGQDGEYHIDLGVLTGSYKVNIIDTGNDKIEKKQAEYQEEIISNQQKLDELTAERFEKSNNINGKHDYDELQGLDRQIEEITKKLENAESNLSSIVGFGNELLDYSNLDIIRDSFDNAAEKVDEYNNGITKLNTAIDSINEGNAISYSDMVELIDLYPQLKDSVIETADGYTIQISALEEAINQFYDTRDASIRANIDMVETLKESTEKEIALYKASATAALVSANVRGACIATLDEFLQDDDRYQSLMSELALYEYYISQWESRLGKIYSSDSSGSGSSDSGDITDGIQNQIDYYETLLDAVTIVSDKVIDGLEKEKDAIDTKIEALNDEKEALQDKNDEEQRTLDLLEAQNNLDKARKQKVFVYKKGEGLVQVQDEKSITDAEQQLREVQTEIKIADIDKQIEAYEKQQDGIDDIIDNIDSYKDQFSNMENDINDTLTVDKAKAALGTDENGLLNLNEQTITDIRNGLAQAVYKKDVNDNKENSNRVTVRYEDYLKSLGSMVSPQECKSIITASIPDFTASIPKTNTLQNVQTFNGSVTVNPTINIYDARDPNKVADTVKNYISGLFTQAINTTK